jgi:choline dehydrogenase-like flavoprotein
LLPEYDFVIVGGGSAGCVVANRLSEDPSVSVLLIEAGHDETITMDVPIFAGYLQLGPANWGYKTQSQESACLGLKNQRCSWPRGKVLGGSSVLNYMVYTRGNKNDYNKWRDAGNYGWGYEDVLPYFQKLEDVQLPGLEDINGIRGTNGPLTVTYPPYLTEIARTFVAAGKEFGFSINDHNGETQTGFGLLQATLRNGTRLSTNRAYLMPIKDRKNLHVKKSAQVTKILINPVTKHAYGVAFISNGIKYKVKSKKEVILSAGVIGTPQLLMLSGIGPKYHLHSLNIPVIKNLMVGYNLQDHIVNGGITFLINKNVSLLSSRLFRDGFDTLGEYTDFHMGPLTVPGGIEAIAFVNTRLNTELNDYPDIELLLLGGSIASDPTLTANFGVKEDLYQKVFKPIEHMDAFTIFPLLLRPKSRGRILLKSKNPFKSPIIYHNYLTEKEDINVLVEGTKAAIELVKSKAFQEHGTKLHDIPLPACTHLTFGSDKYWKCTTRQLTLTIYHQCCTAKMGPPDDIEAVVDPELRVYGVTGLRIIDASVMPFVTNGHTNAPTIMIAERASDLIKSYWYNKYK